MTTSHVNAKSNLFFEVHVEKEFFFFNHKLLQFRPARLSTNIVEKMLHCLQFYIITYEGNN